MINQTGHQDGILLTPLAATLFDTMIQSCGGIHFVSAGDPGGPDFLTNPPRIASGIINGLKMALLARQTGFNFILSATVTDIRYEKESSWYNWLIKDDDRLYLIIRTEIFDTHTGSKIFHDTFEEVFKMKPMAAEKLTIPEIMALKDFNKLSARMAKTMAKKICAELKAAPWKGHILSADGQKGVLSSGTEAGIKVNDVFSVYKNSGVITGFGNLQYVLPGPRVGEVRVTGVTKDRADVVSLSDVNLSPDMVVQ
jgi:hypothetical protein